MLNSLFCGFLIVICPILSARASEVVIKSTAPAIIGSRVNFTAELHEDGAISPSRQYRFKWLDNTNPSHTQTFETTDAISNFSVTYNASIYSTGVYRMQVTVERLFVGFWVNIAKNSIQFSLNDLLVGNITLSQNGTLHPNEFVAIRTPVNHTVVLNPSDAEYISNATKITTHWYRNCNYLGPSAGLSTVSSYDKENETYDIEAFVVVSFEKIEPITTTPSTTTTTSTPKPASSSEHPPTPTATPINQATTAKAVNGSEILTKQGSNRRRREAGINSTISPKIDDKTTPKPNLVVKEISASGEEIEVKQTVNTTTMPTPLETNTNRSTDNDFSSHPNSCMNISQIYHDPKNVYGYFKKRIVGKRALGNISLSANSWLQRGELFHLQVKCEGSASLEYCIKIIEGPYNATGNETCAEPLHLDECSISFTHLFQWTTPRTILVIVQNNINRIVTQVAVNFYEATKQSQLSVIVVPVSFCLVAVILAVFGVAYYIQNRHRYIIEVANFNFGDSQSVDMEYKTFHARLLDSIREVVPWPRRQLDHDAGESHSGEDSSIKYGSMT